MLLLAISIFIFQVVTAQTVYLLIALQIMKAKDVGKTYQKVRNALVSATVWVMQRPIWMQIAAISIVAIAHQLLLFQVPYVITNFKMSNWFETKFLSTGLSDVFENVSVYIQQRAWVKMALLPLIVYIFIVTTILFTIIWYATDPATSSAALWLICIPVMLSVILWKLEELLPKGIRQHVLRTWSPNQIETPRSGIKTKSMLIAILTIAVLGALIIMFRFNYPIILQVMLGQYIDSSIYIGTMAAACIATGAIVSIVLDGQTLKERTTIWTDEVVHNYHHQIMLLMCFVLFAMFESFPYINHQFFANRMMVLSKF